MQYLTAFFSEILSVTAHSADDLLTRHTGWSTMNAVLPTSKQGQICGAQRPVHTVNHMGQSYQRPASFTAPQQSVMIVLAYQYGMECPCQLGATVCNR